MPKVSVLIPTYNRPLYLREALDSVFSQTYRDYEVIVVDDGSTDNTRQLAQSYGSRIKYFFQENQGRSGARNTGVRLAQGELVAFLDSDDRWFPNKLERQVRYLDEHRDIDFLHGHVEMTGEDGQVLNELTKETQAIWSRSHRRGETYANWLLECRCLLSTVVIRSKCLKEVGPFDPNIPANEELDLYLRIAAKHKIEFLGGDPVTRYRVHPGNSGNDNLSRGGILVAHKHLAALLSRPRDVKRRLVERNLHLFLSRNHFMLGQNREGRKFFMKALLQNPSSLGVSPHLRLFLASFLPDSVRTKLKSRRALQAQTS